MTTGWQGSETGVRSGNRLLAGCELSYCSRLCKNIFAWILCNPNAYALVKRLRIPLSEEIVRQGPQGSRSAIGVCRNTTRTQNVACLGSGTKAVVGPMSQPNLFGSPLFRVNEAELSPRDLVLGTPGRIAGAAARFGPTGLATVRSRYARPSCIYPSMHIHVLGLAATVLKQGVHGRSEFEPAQTVPIPCV